MSGQRVKQQVRQFYDQVGWQVVESDRYQNARYEDLRPVSQEYIHRCHLRVLRYLKPQGRYLLDAGSGPVQYPEYLTYSSGYDRRVCLDISLTALQEARRRLGDHGIYVVADVAHLPFEDGRFEGLVSLHTLHHLPVVEQPGAYKELYRSLAAGCSGVVVNGWTNSPLMAATRWLISLMEWIGIRVAKLRGREARQEQSAVAASTGNGAVPPTGTYVQKLDSHWLRKAMAGNVDYEIFVWRSVSVRFLRALIYRPLGGHLWLRMLYRLEERFPRFFGENGQYPLIVLRKPG